MGPILVVGASGLLGSEICRLLCGSKHSVRGLVRPGSPREDTLRGFGVETILGDLRDPGSLEAACRGVTTVISAATGVRRRLPGDSVKSVDRDGQRALLDVARREDVRRFVFVSVSPTLPHAIPLVRYKRETEVLLRESGMEWVIVQSSPFMETSLSRRAGFDVTAGKVVLLGHGEAPVSYVSVHDVARAVAGIGGDRSRLSRYYVLLGGPDPLSPLGAARVFEEECGRRFSVLRAPASLAKGVGVLLRPFSPDLASALGMAAHMADSGDVVRPSRIMKRLVERPVTLRAYARSEARAALMERVRLRLRGAGGTRV
jgi:uncharacterized protein YbjT (DUF2867 family)